MKSDEICFPFSWRKSNFPRPASLTRGENETNKLRFLQTMYLAFGKQITLQTYHIQFVCEKLMLHLHSMDRYIDVAK